MQLLALDTASDRAQIQFSQMPLQSIKKEFVHSFAHNRK